MRRPLVGACALLLASVAGTARAGPPPEPLRVEFPLGPFVRPGRPLVVRVSGAPDRVRGPGGPWALPQGARGDEFVLQLGWAGGGALPLEAERDGRVEMLRVDVSVLGPDSEFAGDFAEPRGPGGAALPLHLLVRRLPTVREGWLVLDEVRSVPDGLDPAVAAALEAWRAGPRAGAREAFEPLLHPPGSAAFRAAREASARAPRLPADVRTVLVLGAGAELLLLLLLGLRSDPPWARSAWLSAPPLLVGAWLFGASLLPGPLTATALVLEGREDRLVVLRVVAERDGAVELRVPPSATSPALLRFAADDASLREASTGRSVRLALRQGEVRLVAYRVPPLGGPWEPGPEAPPAPPELGAWVRGLGLAAAGPGRPLRPEEAPRGLPVVPSGALRVVEAR